MNNDLSKIIEDVVRDVLKTEKTDELNLKVAKKLAAIVEDKAAEIGVKAVVAIADAGARPILVECMDDSFIASYDIAFGKAYTVVSLKMSTSKLKKLAEPGGSLYGIQFTNGGKIVIFGGGEPLYNKKGELIGGLGVSGGTEAQDTALAEYGKKVFESRSF